ncbi:hypothetical protein OEZ86_013207 [Tetradesmus obliquus]|nr:hypothetical protein OEZ86_013207 [Tetradesmus obliquus]
MRSAVRVVQHPDAFLEDVPPAAELQQLLARYRAQVASGSGSGAAGKKVRSKNVKKKSSEGVDGLLAGDAAGDAKPKKQKKKKKGKGRKQQQQQPVYLSQMDHLLHTLVWPSITAAGNLGVDSETRCCIFQNSTKPPMMPRLVTSSAPVLLLLLLTCASCSPASASRRLFNIQARVPDSTTAAVKPVRNSLLYECFCISTYPYIKHEKRFVQAADAADVGAGKVPTCPAGGWQPGSAAYGSTGCRLVKGQLD